MVVEWYEDDGVLGGQRGLTIDYGNGLVHKWNGDYGPIEDWDKEEVKWVLTKNINDCNKRLSYCYKKLAQTEPIRTKIEGGHSLNNPLTDEGKEIFKARIDRTIKTLLQLTEKLKELD